MSCFIYLFVSLSALDSHINIPPFLSLCERQLAFICFSLFFNMSNWALEWKTKMIHHSAVVTCVLCNQIYMEEMQFFMHLLLIKYFLFVSAVLQRSNSTLELFWLRWKHGLRTTGLTLTTIQWWHYESFMKYRRDFIKEKCDSVHLSREFIKKTQHTVVLW